MLTAFYKLPCELSLKAYRLNVNVAIRRKGHRNDQPLFLARKLTVGLALVLKKKVGAAPRDV